jgi:hypothetical protein
MYEDDERPGQAVDEMVRRWRLASSSDGLDEHYGETQEEQVDRWEREDRQRQEKNAGLRSIKPNGNGIAPLAKPESVLPRLLSSSAFCESFVPPDPLVEGIIMRGFIYALTAHTGRGKTAVALLIAYCVALGRKLGDLEVEKGRVLFLAGENSVDVQMRWIAMSQQLDFDPGSIDVVFIDERFKFSQCMDQLRTEIEAANGFDLIIVDSSFAFFEGEDENSNAQQGEHTARLRQLTQMAGKPAVLVLCHPPKNARDDNLQPRGGGAYVAEVDGNLTLTLTGTLSTLHWQTKFRGPDFAPMNFARKVENYQEQANPDRIRQAPVGCGPRGNADGRAQ